MEAEHPVPQAFGSPGGKSYLAPRIVGMMPSHKVYVEPFCLPPKTTIKTQGGWKRIDRVDVGDSIVTMDGCQPITKIW